MFIIFLQRTQQFALVKICFSHEATRKLILQLTVFAIVTGFQVFCFCFVCQLFNGYGGTSNYTQCCMSEGSCTLSVCSIKLHEFVLTLDGAYEIQDFEDVYNEEIFLIIHIFRLIGIPPSIYMHLFIYLAMGRSGLLYI